MRNTTIFIQVLILTPYLNQQDLLTDDESEKLCGRALTRSEKIDLIVQVLPYKGRDWWNKYLCCLTESATEPGLPAHQESVVVRNEETQQREYQQVSIAYYLLILPLSFNSK